MLDIKVEKNVPTLVVLIAVILAIALLPQYKDRLRSLNSNLAGLIIGFICVIMFLLIDPKVATLLLFVILVFYYTNVKDETISRLDNFEVKPFSEAEQKLLANEFEIETKTITAAGLLTKGCSDFDDSVKQALGNLDSQLKDDICSPELFQSTQERISEGFVRDRVPEVMRHEMTNEDPTNLVDVNPQEGFQNHLENTNQKELLAQNLANEQSRLVNFHKNQGDVSGCRYDGKKLLNGEFEEYFGTPVADCSNYTRDGVERTGTAFYPLNR